MIEQIIQYVQSHLFLFGTGGVLFLLYINNRELVNSWLAKRAAPPDQPDQPDHTIFTELRHQACTKEPAMRDKINKLIDSLEEAWFTTKDPEK